MSVKALFAGPFSLLILVNNILKSKESKLPNAFDVQLCINYRRNWTFIFYS